MLQNLSNAITKRWFSKSNKPSRRMTIYFLDAFCNLHDSGIEHPEKLNIIHRRAKQRHVKSKNATLSISFNTIYKKNEHRKITTPVLNICNT
jgi:hypothetical protein